MTWADVERYVAGLADGETAWISSATAARGALLLAVLRAKLPGLGVPQAAPGPDGLLGFTWRDGANYLNLEVRADGVVEEFHENLASGALWSGEGPDVSAEFVSRLALVRG